MTEKETIKPREDSILKRLDDRSKHEMISLKVPLFKPFIDFLQEYPSFFGSDKTVETFIMRAVYEKVEALYCDLGAFAGAKKHLLDGEDWFNKHSHLGCVSVPDAEPEE